MAEAGSVVIAGIEDGTLTIGRADDCGIVVSDLLVSRHHAEVTFKPDSDVSVRDLRSSNGTYVNGQRIKDARLREGDVITIGRTSLTLQNGQLIEHVDDALLEFTVDQLSVCDSKGRPIIHDVSFEVPPHTMVAVIGPSGAGKSTVVKAIVGAVTPSTGSVRYGGVDLLDRLGSTRRRIGYVPQDDILHGGLTVERSLHYAARLRLSADVTDAEIEEQITDVLSELGLLEHRHKRVDQLSGGQRKRASTAMELLTRPPLLILDEPSSGLDPGNEKVLMELLRDIAKDTSGQHESEARRVVVVTHSLQSIELCDFVLVIAPGDHEQPGGSVCYFGRPDGLATHFEVDDPAEVFTKLEIEGPRWSKRHLQQRQPSIARPPPAAVDGSEAREHSQLRWQQQLLLLSRRYAETIRADRTNVAILVLQAPVIGLMLAMITAGAFEARSDTPSPGVMVLLLGMVLSITYLGASNSIRELVKERAIRQREAALGVHPAAQVGAKLLVLAVIVLAQTVVLVLLATSRAGTIEADPLLPLMVSSTQELILIVGLAGIAAVAIGLAVSAVVTNADKAMSTLPVVLARHVSAVRRTNRHRRRPCATRDQLREQRPMGPIRGQQNRRHRNAHALR